MLVAATLILALEVSAGFLVSAQPAEAKPARFGSELRVPTITESMLQWQFTHLLELKTPHDVLLLGDSSCLMGLRPKLMEEELKTTVWNLGTLGWIYTDSHADLLEIYVERVGAPKVLVYQVAWGTLQDSKRDIRQRGYRKRFVRFRDRLLGKSPPRLVPPLWEKGETLLAPARDAYLEWVGLEPEKLRAKPRTPWPSDDEVRRQLLERQGNLDDPRTLKKKRRVRMKRSISPDAKPGLERIFALAKKHGFSVLLALNPVPERAKSSESNLEVAERMTQDMEAIAKAHPHVDLIRPWVRFEPGASFATKTHLTPAAAIDHSKRVAARIKDELDAR